MGTKVKATLLWVVATLLFLASGWSFNIAVGNYWAASFHDPYTRVYESHGNIFFIITLVLFAAFASVVIATLRWTKKRRLAKI